MTVSPNSNPTPVPGFVVYPCDRGTGRPMGYHNFQAPVSGGLPCCIYCGKTAPAEPMKVTCNV